ncbi:MAG: chaperone modulator CbpM [Nocardioidaceae bacterium]
MGSALARPTALELDAFARLVQVHPQLLRQLVSLGLLEPVRDASGRLWFPYTDVAAVARLQRLRAAFSLNYAALGLVVDLLDRIAALEAAQPNRSRSPRGQSWT